MRSKEYSKNKNYSKKKKEATLHKYEAHVSWDKLNNGENPKYTPIEKEKVSYKTYSDREKMSNRSESNRKTQKINKDYYKHLRLKQCGF